MLKNKGIKKILHLQTTQMENYPLLAFDFNGYLTFMSFVNSLYFKFDVVLINITFLR